MSEDRSQRSNGKVGACTKKKGALGWYAVAYNGSIAGRGSLILNTRRR